MLKREWGAESNGKLPHLFIPSKTAPLVPEFAMEVLGRTAALVLEFAVEYQPLDRTATLVPVFAVKDLTLGRTLYDDKGMRVLGGIIYFFLVLGANYLLERKVYMSKIVLY